MMKPKRTIATRYRREVEQPADQEHVPNTSGYGFHYHNPPSPRRNNASRVDANRNKNREVPNLIALDNMTDRLALNNVESEKNDLQKELIAQRKKFDVVTSLLKSKDKEITGQKLALNNVESEKNDLQKELIAQRKKFDVITSLLKSKDKEITGQNQSIKDFEKKLKCIRKTTAELIESSKTRQNKITSLIKGKEKLKKKITSLQNDIRKSKVQNEENDKLLQKARQSCVEVFNSRIHPNFVRAHSNLIADIVKVYESYCHGDKTQHCPVTQYMNSVPGSTTSSWVIEDIASNDGPPSKKRKMDNSSMSIDKHYSKSSLKELVMDLEMRHSDNYELWRNVLWALNKYGRERGYDTLKIADCFSKRSSKYKNLQDVKITFESSDGTLSLQYLIEISKIYEEGLDAMTEYLHTILSPRYLPLTIKQVDIRDRQNFRLTVNYADESHTLLIIPDLYILGNEDGKRICFLENKITSEKSELSSLCPEMKKGFVVILEKEHYEFRARNKPSATIQLIRPLKPDESFIILPSGKRNDKELNLTEIRNALRAEAIKLLSAKSGKKFGDYKDDSDTFEIPNEDSNVCRTDTELVDALMNTDPDTMSRYCYSNGAIYYCNPSTNLWCILSNVALDSHLRQNLKTALKLTKTEVKYINMAHAIVRIRNVTLDKIENINFLGLDSNSRLFITKNKTIVTSSIPPIIRNIDKEDLAESTCGWSYNYELSIKYMESVQSYFVKLIPRQCEREWFLSFVAKMLNGQRINEYFLVLTGKREDKNGISTLMSLLETVFGNYFIANTKFVVVGGTRDNNQYDGGIYNLKGKRLLVADKLQKTDNLNCGFIKAITSQSIHYIQDKRKFSRIEFKFPVHAGLIMTFTEDDIPKFDKNDPDFVKRMVAIPMLSRFLSKQEIDKLTQDGQKMTNIHIADDSLKLQFPEWSSAVLDLIIKYYNESLPSIPNSMVKSTKRLCSAIYDDYDWMDSHVRKDDNEDKFVTAEDIMTAKTKSEKHNSREMKKLKVIMCAWADKNGFCYKPRHVYKVGYKRRVEAKSAIMGCRLHDVDEE